VRRLDSIAPRDFEELEAMVQSIEQEISDKLDVIAQLLQHLLALELARDGVSRAQISKHLRVANAATVKMLKGVKKAPL
jgi:hypothetical protein